MTKAVFIASSHSDYLDKPGEVYHFPNRYLGRVENTVGDWVVFYEGRRGGNRGYYAVQRVGSIQPDPSRLDHSFAVLERATELSFETFVPRLDPHGTPFESELPKMGGNNTAAVRLISEPDFARIVAAGLTYAEDEYAIPRIDGLEETSEPFDYEPLGLVERSLQTTNRKYRDATFSRQVRRAYNARCAMSGLDLRNGRGRPEVEAAHIIPVAHNGPDTVRNGLALSGTLHWMFDRGLLSVDDDHRILMQTNSVADEVASRLILSDRRLILPMDAARRPHPEYLRWHRENIFKG